MKQKARVPDLRKWTSEQPGEDAAILSAYLRFYGSGALQCGADDDDSEEDGDKKQGEDGDDEKDKWEGSEDLEAAVAVHEMLELCIGLCRTSRGYLASSIHPASLCYFFQNASFLPFHQHPAVCSALRWMQ